MTAGDESPGRRFPRSVFDAGSEPDVRFTLANERTYLAWVRTSLALIASGVGLEAFDVPIDTGLRFPAALLLVALGTLAPLQAWFRWTSTERALRNQRPLPAPHLAGPIGIGVGIAGLLIVIGLLIS